MRVRVADKRRAHEIIATSDDRGFSLTDALTYAVMVRVSINHAFTFDRHSGQLGFIEFEQPA